jgi:hypothetical protein
LRVGLLEGLGEVVVVVDELAVDFEEVLVLLDEFLALGTEVLILCQELILILRELNLEPSPLSVHILTLVLKMPDLEIRFCERGNTLCLRALTSLRSSDFSFCVARSTRSFFAISP